MNAEDEKFIEAFYILTGRVPILPLEIDFNGIEELHDNNLIEAKKSSMKLNNGQGRNQSRIEGFSSLTIMGRSS